MLGILLAILPKCPLCVITYSSAVAFCGGVQQYNLSQGSSLFLYLGFAVLTFSMILINYKGTRSLFALFYVLLGTGLVLYGQLFSTSFYYYAGAGLLLWGCWLNGSFSHFFRRGIQALKGTQRFSLPFLLSIRTFLSTHIFTTVTRNNSSYDSSSI